MSSSSVLLETKRKSVWSPLSIPDIEAGEGSATIYQATADAVLHLSNSARFIRSTYEDSAPPPLEQQLFDVRAACKIKTAEVAMHLDQGWRKRFFRQLDTLLDPEEWDALDTPITIHSFSTLLRMLMLVKPKRRPGLGATFDGNVIAAWTIDKNRLTIECLPDDEVRWVVLHYLDYERETAAGQTGLLRLRDVLQPYNPDRWLADEGAKTST
jgi:hypothetical protein